MITKMFWLLFGRVCVEGGGRREVGLYMKMKRNEPVYLVVFFSAKFNPSRMALFTTHLVRRGAARPHTFKEGKTQPLTSESVGPRGPTMHEEG